MYHKYMQTKINIGYKSTLLSKNIVVITNCNHQSNNLINVIITMNVAVVVIGGCCCDRWL